MIAVQDTTGPRRFWPLIDRAGGGLAADFGLYALSAVFAALTAATSALASHRDWGTVALIGYATATVLAGGQLVLHRRGLAARLTSTPARAVVTCAAWAATALLPLVLQAVARAAGRTNRAQEEVVVVERGGIRLLEHGTPYLTHDAIAALPPSQQLLGYLPYQPGMALFGLPRALAEPAWWTDARVWFALVTAGALALAVGVLRRPLPGAPDSAGAGGSALVRAMQLATVLPVCALALATGGDDLPVLALCLLALALCRGRRYGVAGLAAGFGATLKLFAWPVVLVLLVHAFTRGWRTGTRFAAGALGLPLLTLLPAQLVDSAALLENVVRFPLGKGVVTSPAQSPLPGHLIASALPDGWIIAVTLLLAVAAAIAIRLARRPPGTATTAATIIGYGLLAAMLLMPSTRFGYVLYPVAFLAWAPALRLAAPDMDAPSAAPLRETLRPRHGDLALTRLCHLTSTGADEA